MASTLFRYQVRHVIQVSDDVVIAHISPAGARAERRALAPYQRPRPTVLGIGDVRARSTGRAVVAGRRPDTPMRPGGAVPAATGAVAPGGGPQN